VRPRCRSLLHSARASSRVGPWRTTRCAIAYDASANANAVLEETLPIPLCGAAGRAMPWRVSIRRRCSVHLRSG
jgi:hypothetical protein